MCAGVAPTMLVAGQQNNNSPTSIQLDPPAASCANLTMFTISTSIPAPSPLLSLPPELRNRIFAYALTSSTSTLQYSLASTPNHPVFSDTANANHNQEFNQLKYACRQLYAETAGLEVKHNALRFDLPEDDAYTLARVQNSVDSGFSTPNSEAPSTTFPPFLYSCAPDKRKWLSRIIITIRKPASYSLSQPTVDRLLSLAKFKRENAHVEITYEYVDEVYEYSAPKWQVSVPWLSVAVCLGVALPVEGALRPVVDAVSGLCGKGSLVFWGAAFGVWDLVGLK
ncbi:uncharacterized protein CC84DRAFT_1202368 [Paraphaeosphaeria sporulosa]|uniref:F-box domain-containing protein n=1 Tax=Paraphaeosphaeria sporulosa TaxID=1460663 RepID=A0A177CQA4_9PLEO|nr:uncharacterized protein CC84DRAFT_1202368 [Paraphaeosphaeria sporulosa]OAG09705.1 hypothetical protein CC84DRAFT_1202368 [Paraphaeosphaeria sporulosa]